MNKTALITGASGGIGYELALIHAARSGNLVLVARSEGKLQDLKTTLESKHPISVHIICKDLSLPQAAQEVFDEVKSRGITVDYLVNNAGFGDFGMFSETSWAKEEQMINLNITSLTLLTKLFIRDMMERGGGKIMNLASVAAFLPGPTMAVYYATKAYVLSFSQAVYNEVKDTGITVTTLCPGPTVSGFQEAAGLENSSLFNNKGLPTSREVAEYGYTAMLKGKTVAVHGLRNRLLVFAARFVPRSLLVKSVRKIQAKRKTCDSSPQ
jgi:short-subunit dehydrogenase